MGRTGMGGGSNDGLCLLTALSASPSRLTYLEPMPA